MDARYYPLGVAQYYLGDRSGAQASFERLAAAKAKSEAERLAMTGAGYATLLDYPIASTFYDRAVAADPTNTAILTDRGSMRYDAGDIEGAGKDLQKALQLDKPGVYQYGLQAQLQFSNGQYEKGVEDGDNMVRLRPELVAGYLCQGINYLLIGQRSKAMEVFNNGLHHATGEDNLARMSIWYTLAGGTVDEKLRQFLLQFSEQQWPNPLVRYYFGGLDEQACLKLAKRRDPALSNQQESEACLYIGARLLGSDVSHARELLEKAASSKLYHGFESVIARKELEHDFLK
jgi:tetratricopeptide (TPR) repeat protein